MLCNCYKKSKNPNGRPVACQTNGIYMHTTRPRPSSPANTHSPMPSPSHTNLLDGSFQYLRPPRNNHNYPCLLISVNLDTVERGCWPGEAGLLRSERQWERVLVRIFLLAASSALVIILLNFKVGKSLTATSMLRSLPCSNPLSPLGGLQNLQASSYPCGHEGSLEPRTAERSCAQLPG